ncbi:MAG TPA: murein biosynthesis integral membrane protein MurJ [Stellaceae bacterium]|nr:murein biosynthesis integral membrane protein MurJ [Stellaceae bacterium]
MSLLRAAATIGGYTMISRVLAFIRDMLTASVLGAGPVAEALFIAQRLPNMFRSLFAEGAFSVAFVPTFAGMVEAEGREAAQAFAERILAVLLVVLLLMLALAEALMPWVIYLIAPGFSGDPAKLAYTIELTRITFPYLLFISLVTLLGGVLNSFGKFAAAAATPVLLNLFLIGGLLLGCHIGDTCTGGVASIEATGTSGRIQALAISLAGLAQFIWLMVSCARAGLVMRLPRPRLTPAVRKLLTQMLPATLGAGMSQVNLLVSTGVATFLPAGSVAYLYYADRLNQLPLGVVGIAVATAIVPTLSRQLRAGDEKAANHTLNRGLELALLLTLPAAIALGVIADPILAVLFQRGNFGSVETAGTAAALSAYAVGLPAFVLVKVLAPGFYARHDVRTPVRAALVSLVVNIVLTLALALPLAHVGNALATTIAGWVNALQLIWLMHRRGHLVLDGRFRRRVPRVAASAIGMGLVLLAAMGWLWPILHGGPLVFRVTALAGLIALGLGGFALLALVSGAGDWRELARLVRRQPA